MTEKAKEIMTGPGSLWASVVMLCVASVFSWLENKSVQEDNRSFAYEAEESLYGAVIDLRKKVDYLHTKLIEVEMSVKPVFPPGPPSEPTPIALPVDIEWGHEMIRENCKRCPDCCVHYPEQEDAGIAPEADAVEPEKDVVEEETVPKKKVEKEQKEIEVQNKLDWVPLNRPSRKSY